MKLSLSLPLVLVLCGMLHVQSEHHYGNPQSEDGCMDDETSAKIFGISGVVCVPPCGDDDSCPNDAGDGLDPECILQMYGSGLYCALQCDPQSESGCPEGAACQPISGVGICTYAEEESKGYYTQLDELIAVPSIDISDKKFLRQA
mmetsp:Transcript_18503/g.25458  ORF Transcript_18503/g.25458 Transcript_18503/m.25458 type:complete len:146 (-) Transcript_18503:300-737(-)